MKRRWKWLLAVTVLILSTPLLVTAALVFFVDTDHYKTQLRTAVESRTGRPLIIDGALKLAIGFTPTLTAEKIRYPNPAWASREWAVEIDKVTVAVNVWTLLRGGLRFSDIILENPKLWVERNAAGQYNLRDYDRPPRKKKSRPFVPLLSLEIDNAKIIDGDINIATPSRNWEINIAHAHATSAGFTAPVTVNVRGAVEGVPLVATVTGGSIKTLITQQPSPLTADGWVGDEKNRVYAVGSARNVLKWRGIDLDLEVDAARVSTLSPLARVAIPGLGNVTGRARLLQPNTFGSMQLRAVELQSTHHGITGILRGEIANLIALRDIGFDFTASGKVAHQLPEWLRATLGRAGDITVVIAADLRGAAHDSLLRITTARMQTPGLLFDAAGEFNYRAGAWRGAVPATMTVTPTNDATDAPDELPARALAAIGVFRAQAELVNADSRWQFHNLTAAVERAGVVINASGAVEKIGVQPAGYFNVDAKVSGDKDFAMLFPFAPSSFELNADFKFGDGQLSGALKNFSARAFGMDFTADGVAHALHEWHGIDINIRGRTDGLHRLPSFTGRAFPAGSPVRLTARLIDDGDDFKLTDINAIADGKPYQLTIAGAIENLRTAPTAELTAAATINHGRVLREIFGDEAWLEIADAVVPMTVSANLASTDIDDWTVRDLNVVAADGKISVTGEADANAGVNEVTEARLNLVFDDVATAQLPLSWKLPRPADGALNAAFALTATPVTVGIHNLTAAVTADDVSFNVRGDIDRVQPFSPDRLKLTWDAQTVAALNWNALSAFKPDLPTTGSIAVTSTARRHKINLDVAIGENNLHGDIDWTEKPANKITNIVYADLNSDDFDLRKSLKASKKSARVFSPRNINVDWLNQTSGEINFNAAIAGNHFLTVHNMKSRTTLTDGIVKHQARGMMGDGALSVAFTLDANEQPPLGTVTVRGDQLRGADLGLLQNEEVVDSGTVNADIALTAAGWSIAELAAASDGHISLRLDDARMINQRLDHVGGDIFSNLAIFLNPFRKVDEEVNIECGVVNFMVRDGKALGKNSLAVKTDKVTLLGGGGVDFHDESLRILISPKARKGFGINPSSLAKIARLGGTLADPKIETDGSRLFETGAAVWAAFYSGGWSLLAQGLLDRNRANTDVCGVAGRDGGNGGAAGDGAGNGGFGANDRAAGAENGK